MKKLFNLFAAVALLSASAASVQAQDFRVIEEGGQGPYKAIMTGDPTLATHTIFCPQDLSKFGKNNPLPILVWGNGGCANSPREHINFLNEIASQGFMVIAIGPFAQAPQNQGGPQGQGAPQGMPQMGGMPRPQGQGAPQGMPQMDGMPRQQGQGAPQGMPQMGGMPRPQGQGAPQGMPQMGGMPRPQGQGAPQGMPQMGGGGGMNSNGQALVAAMDWAIAACANKESKYYEKLDIKNIAAAGMSCGGLQALDIAKDERLKTVMICNSGLFNASNADTAVPGMPMPAKESLKDIHTPIMYMLGGPTDIAYENGMDDFKRIDHVPAFACNLPVGHGGTYGQPHGGEYSVVATAWLKWQLKGDKEAGMMFTGANYSLSTREGWTSERKKIE